MLEIKATDVVTITQAKNTDGFDGHSVRAVGYWPEAFPGIDANDPKQVNVLKEQEHPLRQESKIPTFALTYFGTYLTLVKNLGWPVEKAKQVEARYHELYKVSDQWADAKLEQATKDGYVTVAFGLRVRTPLLSQVVWGSPKMPSAASAEGRTAGNALGQSYCMLTMRAMTDFMSKVWASPYRLRIKPAALIHDANYLLIDDDVEVVEWANRELIASMRWQDLPEIQHDKVKLGASLGIFWPDWAHETTLPNDADRATIINICRKAKEDLLAKGRQP
jgi:DNA polymerase-1